MSNDPLSEARYRHFLEMQRRQQLRHQASEPPQKHKINLKFGWVFVALLAISVPATLLLLNQEQDIRQSAAPQNNIVKVINNDAITKEDLDQKMRDILGDDFAKSSENKKIKKIATDELVREKIILQEAKKRNILVNEKEIDDEAEKLGFKEPFDRNKIYLKVLEEKLKGKVISWRLIDYLFVYKEPILPNYESLAEKAKSSMEKIKEKTDKGKSMKQAYEEAIKEPGFDKQIKFTQNRRIFYDEMDKNISETIFKHKKGETTEVIDSQGGTFILAKILDSNETRFDNYEDWLLLLINSVK